MKNTFIFSILLTAFTFLTAFIFPFYYFETKTDAEITDLKNKLETLQIDTRYVDDIGQEVKPNIVRLMVIDHFTALTEEDSLILDNYLKTN